MSESPASAQSSATPSGAAGDSTTTMASHTLQRDQGDPPMVGSMGSPSSTVLHVAPLHISATSKDAHKHEIAATRAPSSSPTDLGRIQSSPIDAELASFATTMPLETPELTPSSRGTPSNPTPSLAPLAFSPITGAIRPSAVVWGANPTTTPHSSSATDAVPPSHSIWACWLSAYHILRGAHAGSATDTSALKAGAVHPHAALISSELPRPAVHIVLPTHGSTPVGDINAVHHTGIAEVAGVQLEPAAHGAAHATQQASGVHGPPLRRAASDGSIVLPHVAEQADWVARHHDHTPHAAVGSPAATGAASASHAATADVQPQHAVGLASRSGWHLHISHHHGHHHRRRRHATALTLLGVGTPLETALLLLVIAFGIAILVLTTVQTIVTAVDGTGPVPAVCAGA